MKLSFQPSNELRANTEPRARPESAKSINELSRASSQAGTQAKLSRSPSLNHAYRARSVVRSRLSQDEPSRHIDLIPEPGRIRTNPSTQAESRAPSWASRRSAVVEQIRVVPSSSRARPKAGTEPRTQRRAELWANFGLLTHCLLISIIVYSTAIQCFKLLQKCWNSEIVTR